MIMNRLMKLISFLTSVIFLLTSTAFAGEKVFFYHTDPAGSPIAMTDSIGNVVWTADYKPFGEEQATPGIIDNNREFVGKEKDTESGMSYFGARYMRSEIGRFISSDPVGAVDPHSNKTNESLLINPQRLNLYKYGLNNPYKYIDLNGMFESWGILRATVPGQIYWDRAITSFQGGAYTEGGVYLGAMLTQQVLFVATLGRSRAADMAITRVDAGSAAAESTATEIVYADRAAARQAFSGELREAANRFFRGATSKSTNFKATELSDGAQRLEYFSPANNPGYGKRYVQDIDNAGKIIREFKETIGPNGILETKWVHGGP